MGVLLTLFSFTSPSSSALTFIYLPRRASHCGASKGQLETLKILFHNGANLWIRNAKGDLPLHDAVYSGTDENVKLIQ